MAEIIPLHTGFMRQFAECAFQRDAGANPVPRRSTAQCLARLPPRMRPVNDDDQPTPPRAA